MFNNWNIFNKRIPTTPYHLVPGQVEDNATVAIEISDYDGSKERVDPWTEITITEAYVKRGKTKVNHKTISICLGPDDRKELIEALSKRI